MFFEKLRFLTDLIAGDSHKSAEKKPGIDFRMWARTMGRSCVDHQTLTRQITRPLFFASLRSAAVSKMKLKCNDPRHWPIGSDYFCVYVYIRVIRNPISVTPFGGLLRWSSGTFENMAEENMYAIKIGRDFLCVRWSARVLYTYTYTVTNTCAAISRVIFVLHHRML